MRMTNFAILCLAVGVASNTYSIHKIIGRKR